MHQNSEATTEWKISVSTRLAARIENRLMDPLTRKPAYGMRSKLVNTLLERWLNENPSPIDAPALTIEDIEAISGKAGLE